MAEFKPTSLFEKSKEFVVQKFVKLDGVIGVLLVGSASLGYVDDLSDIDLEVIAKDNLYNRVKKALEDQEEYQGVSVTWEWMRFDELESTIKHWKDDIDLWVYSKCKVLHDPEHKVRSLLARYRHYPNNIWLEKLFLYWYFATGNAPYDSEKAIRRGDFLTAQLCLNQAMEYYTSLIFILNKSFVPYRKWRLKELDKLTYKPERYQETLRKILSVNNWTREEFETKQEIISELVESLKEKLLEGGMPKDKLENPWKFKISYIPRV